MFLQVRLPVQTPLQPQIHTMDANAADLDIEIALQRRFGKTTLHAASTRFDKRAP